MRWAPRALTITAMTLLTSSCVYDPTPVVVVDNRTDHAIY